MPQQLSATDTPRCDRYASGRRIGRALSASILGDLKAGCKWQSCHKLATGNCNTTSLTTKQHELFDEAKRYSLDFVGISST